MLQRLSFTEDTMRTYSLKLYNVVLGILDLYCSRYYVKNSAVQTTSSFKSSIFVVVILTQTSPNCHISFKLVVHTKVHQNFLVQLFNIWSPWPLKHLCPPVSKYMCLSLARASQSEYSDTEISPQLIPS